ncbi:MAG: trigger factor [Acidobacteria bacterium RIFCSPHIGHO2_02_FULL_67_57]|nr:MAG: trigger factor [Acidobacteria bacterium RIFCSPHIGHO2_02_FULL_67_57]OFV84595.1 MAG: trigger factor [Acidobacteria bacterium RIFCSPHIGHO2_01_FULL_67_28]
MAAETNTCQRELEVEIPAETVERETQRVTREFARQVRLPGFRPGKAPAELVRRRFWDDIKSEVLHHLIPVSLENAFKEQNLAPVGDPAIAELSFEPAKPLRFKATFEVLPEIRLGEYKDLEVEPARIELTEEDLERELEALRQRASTFEAVTDRASQDGDTVVASLLGVVTQPKDKRDPITLEDVHVEVAGEGTLEAFSDGLRGARAGEERQFSVAYPADYPEANLAGRAVAFTARVKEVKRRKLPELNDAFAEQVSDLKTLADLKAKLREGLERARGEREKQLTERRLLEALLARHDFPVPEALVERQLDQRLERQARTLLAQGIDPRRAPVDWGRLRREQRAGAVLDVKLRLLVERIAQAEKLEAAEEDITRELERLAREAGQNPQTLRARLTKEGGLGRIESAVRSEKVIEFLRSHARFTAPNRG